jgi:putative Holliday junction resolvase
MGIDYGLKRIGLAMTDVLQIISSPFDTIESLSLKNNALKILEIAKNNSVSMLVFGLPVNMNGTKGEMAEMIYSVVEEIKNFSDIKIALVDERLTTAQAERVLVCEGNVPRQKRKWLKDKVSATLILQMYLDTYRT